jgi:hypothetical protein
MIPPYHIFAQKSSIEMGGRLSYNEIKTLGVTQ